MNYASLEECLTDLERNGMLLRIKEEVDPDLEMAAIHLRVFQQNGPAILFEKVKGTNYRCVSNIFGTDERCRFIFRNTTETVKKLVDIKNDPSKILKHPFRFIKTGLAARKAFPKKVSLTSLFDEIKIADLPLIKHWPMDGGAFITLPQVYSEDAETPGVMKSNLGMYRIQLNGNEYKLNEEIGLHYQIHRGIGVHQSKAMAHNQKLKVSIFVGGPPAHTFSAVMPLPEGISELTFAGVLGGRKFRYGYDENSNLLSADADFVITGEIENGVNKPEGPFGDHLGYYSLTHPFPVMKVKKVYAKKNAIWPFTVVGRPPQEDTAFGNMIHELAGGAIQAEIPGVKEVHAVDVAGVHPLLLAVGSERYTPYLKEKTPSEILTQANHILGSGQLSLAKYLFIAADDKVVLDSHKEKEFFSFMFERMDFTRDLHFQTNTSIDTLDYSGSSINSGSKVVFAAYGEKKRELCTAVPQFLSELPQLAAQLIMPGVISIQTAKFSSYKNAETEMDELASQLKQYIQQSAGIALFVLCDDSFFAAESMSNFMWLTFTRSNPSHDIYGVDAFVKNKHWGCNGALIIDARIKPHHAPPLVADEKTRQRAIEILKKYNY